MNKSGIVLIVLWVAFGLAGCASQNTKPYNPPSRVKDYEKIQGDQGKLVSAKEFWINFNRQEGWSPAGPIQEVEVLDNQARVYFSSGKLMTISLDAGTALRLFWGVDGAVEPDPSYAVIQEEGFDTPLGLFTKPQGWSISTTDGDIQIEVSAAGEISVLQGDRFLLPEGTRIYSRQNRFALTFPLEEGVGFYGLGEKTGPMNKRGHSLKLWNSDTYKYGPETDPVYLSIPFFYRADAEDFSGWFLDNTYQTYFDFGEHLEGRWGLGSLGGNLDLYLFTADQASDILTQYTDLTGRYPLPPLWSLGYQQSRYSYEDQGIVEELAQTFREKKIPADVIYLDIDFMDQYQSFTIDPYNFPEPEEMLTTLDQLGYRTITIIDPGIATTEGYHVFDQGIAGDHFVRISPTLYAEGNVWPGACFFPDFTRPETRDWWGGLYKELLDLGIDGFWNDMNEPSVFNSPNKTLPWEARHYDFGQNSLHAKIHNVYGLEMIRSTYEGMQKLTPDLRIFVLSRSGYAGIQRYAAKWTGDNTASWEHLALNIPMSLGLGISGVPFNGADIGGYSSTPTGEMFVRWDQLGAVIPLFRNHSEKNTDPQEPWMFDQQTEEFSRKAIELRYHLLQYHYDLMREASETGVPPMRPLFFHYSDPQARDIQDQFLLGEKMLVAPVIREGALSREVYFPQGSNWYDLFTGQAYPGGQAAIVDAPLDHLPLFLAEGAAIPWLEVEQYVGELPNTKITIITTPGAGEYSMQFDDGVSLGFERGEYDRFILKKEREYFQILQPADGWSNPDPYEEIEIRYLGADLGEVDTDYGSYTLVNRTLD
jgi:alpha-glucosidase